jgi:hypothetical protein
MRDAKLMSDIATSLQGIDLAPARAAEIAAEVGRLNDAVLTSTQHLVFDDDPADYAALLAKTAPR